jgi:hypothetical protein
MRRSFDGATVVVSGAGSGLANLLFLPVGATAAVVRPRLALLATAAITIGLLFETIVSALAGGAGGSSGMTICEKSRSTIAACASWTVAMPA